MLIPFVVRANPLEGIDSCYLSSSKGRTETGSTRYRTVIRLGFVLEPFRGLFSELAALSGSLTLSSSWFGLGQSEDENKGVNETVGGGRARRCVFCFVSLTSPPRPSSDASTRYGRRLRRALLRRL